MPRSSPRIVLTPTKRKTRIALVGAGNWASALALALTKAGYQIDEIIGRETTASLRRANALARRVGASVATPPRAQIRAEVVWFCVPDGAISAAAASLPDSIDWKSKIALHSSGALGSEELQQLRRRGAAVGSAHPLMTFVKRSFTGKSLAGNARPSLAGISFAMEGDRKAIRTARQIIANLGGNPFAILKEDKPLYHAWGMFLSPLLTALLAASERVAEAAGIPRDSARRRMMPIVHQTIENYFEAGAPGAFSGPITRGDVKTVKKHLEVLRSVPGAEEIYVALARTALGDLPSKNWKELNELLNG
jgi:predicted short-subunit dehydrogenase-like oxidoreductase (DUF2520 family)